MIPASPRPPPAANDLVAAMADEESHLAYAQQLHLRFAADPSRAGRRAMPAWPSTPWSAPQRESSGWWQPRAAARP